MITETVLTILLSVMTTAVASITSLSVKNNADSKISAEDMKAAKAAGSEDFAYISHHVPSVMIALSSGNAKNGFSYPLHHPKVIFDENALATGSSIYAYSAMRWLEEHS